MNKILHKTVLLLVILFSTGYGFAQQLAFPGAEGYGKYVTGGRGGVVYEVTNLNASGTGSFGAAVSASGARTIVFKVSGTIKGDFNIKNGDITIAGQTAPGDGICINGNLSTSANNIIIRYLRIRHDPSIIGDAMGGRFQKNIIIDHCSTSWSADEVLTIYHNENTTVQWCMITEACEKFENGVSVGHRFGGIWGNNYGSWHHNLIAHNDSRNPRWASGCGFNDYRNNVIYNWGYESSYGGESVQVGAETQFSFTTINMVANYYKPGPATIAKNSAMTHIANPSARSTTDKGSWYVADNFFEGNSSITSNNWLGVVGSNYNKMTAPWSAMTFNEQTPQNAYFSVLDHVGCSIRKRDRVDADIIDDVRTGTAKYGIKGIISVPGDVGGWPVLVSETALADSDKDGMPDVWETAKGLNTNDASDRNTVGADGYTNLEKYLNSIEFNYPVTDYTLVKLSSSSFKLGWADNYLAEDGFKVERSYNNGPFVEIAILPTYANTYTDTNVTLTDPGLVTYRVIAFNATNSSPNTTSISNIPAAPVPVTGVSVLPSTATINAGSSTQLIASIIPSNADNKTVTWSSSNTAVATVSTTGKVTGVAEGLATITATTQEGSFTATSTINVLIKPVPPVSGLIILGFNENTGNTVQNLGSAVATFTKTAIPDWSTNVPLNNGGDSSVDFGTTVGNNYVESDAVVSELAGLTSFTITGWVNCKDLSVGSGGNRIVSWINNGANGVDVVHAADGSLKVGINQWPDSSTAISTAGKITANINAAASNWKFFTVSYDSATSSLQIYFGDNTNQAVLDKSLTYNQGAVGATIGKLAIGHFNAESSRTTRTNRMFKGLIDEIGVYNSVLSLSDIQKIQNISSLSIGQRGALENTITLYPNPVTKILTIDLGKEGTTDTVMQLFTIEGKLITKEMVTGITHTLNMENLNSGVYVLKVSNAKGNVVKRIIKQ